jgi:hypothetical protein
MDLDNDGWRDIFVANGIFKDLLDRDFLDIYSNPSIVRSMIQTEESAILRLIEMIPSVKISNYAFQNNKDLTFNNMAGGWGLSEPSFSNGAAYGDLDNDGDLDLVVNNVNMPSFIYRNELNSKPDANYLTIILKGNGMNKSAVGANVTLFYAGKINYQELIPARGFQSSVDSRLHFGLGTTSSIDSVIIEWPEGECTVLHQIAANQFLTIENNGGTKNCQKVAEEVESTVFKKINSIPGLDFKHKENDFIDFERDKLLFQMLSNEGPHIAVGDVNGDGTEDLYMCGAKETPGTLFVQEKNGSFRKTNERLFEADRISEDTDCVFFDADEDGDNDLYVASGGNEFPSSSSALIDRLYLNDGTGRFSKSPQMLPAAEYISTSCVQPEDLDNDGDLDLFAGARLRPFAYGLPVNGYLLENDGKGNFSDVTGKRAPELRGIGMITDMTWADVDNDGDPDMIIVGDWMPVKIFINNNGNFKDESEAFGLMNTEGWWHTIIPRDLNNDGNIDFILGNHGLNSFFKASVNKPVTMYVNDFDLNGDIEQIICSFNGDISYPVPVKDDLEKQIPSLATKYAKYDDFKDQTIEDIFPPEILTRSVKLEARFMESCILINKGGKDFSLVPLVAEAQLSPVYAIYADDFNKDGICDIVLGGNQYKAKPQTGIFAGSYGILLQGNTDGKWNNLSPDASGLFVRGEIRDMKLLNINGERIIVVARNNDNLLFLKY